jgi:hypothetical protein
MSYEETSIFLGNMSADVRTKFLTAMHHAASADASVQASDFITASPGIQASVTPKHVLDAASTILKYTDVGVRHQNR